MPPVTEKSRVSQPHHARTHRDQIMPEGATATVRTNNKYGRLHYCLGTVPRNFLAYHFVLAVRSWAISFSGINPRTPLCKPRRRAIAPLAVRGTKYSGIGILSNPVLCWKSRCPALRHM